MRAVLVAVLVVFSTLTVGVGAGQSGIQTIDDGTRLADDSAAADLRAEGIVSASVERIQLDITVAESGDAVNASSYTLDETMTYVRVDYAEDVPRDVRLHIDGDVVTPRPREGMAPIDEDQPVTADWHVAGDQQSVVLHLDGETHAVFALSRFRGEVSAWKRGTHDATDTLFQNVTGYSLPTFGSGEWSFVPPERLRGENVTYAIPDSGTQMTVQYRSGNETWLSAPECQADAPVCTLRRGNRTVLFAAASDPPQVRFKRGTDLLAGVDSAIDDVMQIPDRIMTDFSRLLGGE